MQTKSGETGFRARQLLNQLIGLSDLLHHHHVIPMARHSATIGRSPMKSARGMMNGSPVGGRR
jgi:hypothetical protein